MSPVEKIAAELNKHDSPRFLDADREDRGALNCRCGVRIPPEPVPYRAWPAWTRDWPAWTRHVAEAVYAVMCTSEVTPVGQ